MPIEAIIFDMDGVLIDSEIIWEEERLAFAAERNAVWTPADQITVMGGTSREWAGGMKRIMKLEDMIVDEIIEDMLRRMNTRYRQKLPIIPGAVEAVQRAASRYPIGLASGSPATVIRAVLELTGLDTVFRVVVSGDEMQRGKPAPDIYLEAARRLGVPPERCAGIEDSSNGIRSLKAAGMRVIAIPHPDYAPAPEVLALADVRLSNIDALTLEVLAGNSTL